MTEQTQPARKKWDSMDEKQQRLLREWRDHGFQLGTSTEPIEHARAEEAVRNVLRFQKCFNDQKFIWFPSIKAVAEFLKENGYSNHLHSFLRGTEEMYWVAHYKFVGEAFGPEASGDVYEPVLYNDEQATWLELWYEIAKSCGWWWPFTNAVLMAERPTEIHFETDVREDEPPRLHQLGGPAVRFSDGFELYSVRGVRVNRNVAMGEFNSDDILKEENAEVRRCMLDIYGQARFIEDIGAKMVHKDDFGELYIVDVFNEEEPLAMVRVENSTPEPDGSVKVYWLAVDPNAYGGLKTARAAVASTWRKEDGSLVFEKPEDYNPDIQT